MQTHRQSSAYTGNPRVRPVHVQHGVQHPHTSSVPTREQEGSRSDQINAWSSVCTYRADHTLINSLNTPRSAVDTGNSVGPNLVLAKGI